MDRIDIPGTSIFGSWFQYNNLFPTYSPNISTPGIQNSDDWARVRENQLTRSVSPDINIRLAIYQDYKKIGSALNLLEVFDFSNVKNIGAIGDAPFIHSLVIKDNCSILNRNPVKFLLTDFESVSVDFGNRLDIKDTDFVKFDLNSDSLDLFLESDLILMWGVDCIVEDSTLLRLFDFCHTNRKLLILGSINCEDIKFNWKRYMLLSNLKNRILRRNLGNLHAFYRTQKYFERLCLSGNVKCEVLLADDIYRVFRIN